MNRSGVKAVQIKYNIKKKLLKKKIFQFYILTIMASNNSNFSVHSGSATKAPVVPQLATGVDRHSADDQGRAQSATGIESDLQARSGGMDLESDTHPGHFDIRNNTILS